MKKLLCLLLALTMVFTAVAVAAEGVSLSDKEGTTSAANAKEAEVAAYDPATAAAEQEFVYTEASIPSLDPQQFDSAAEYPTDKGYMEGLVRTFNGAVNPGAADSWAFNEDASAITFHIRDGACWSDGTPLTANDFVYSFKRLVNPASNAPYGWAAEFIKNASAIMYDQTKPVDELGVYAPDDQTFVIEFEGPSSYVLSFLDLPCFYPVKQELVEKWGDQYALSAEAMLGNGPFVITEYAIDERIVMVPNEYYWNKDAVHLTKVTCLTMEGEPAFASLETGDIDLANIPTAIATAYLADPDMLPDCIVECYQSGAVDWFSVNIASETNPILANKDFRVALNLALDRDEYVAIASSGLYAPGYRYVLDMMTGYDGGKYCEQFPVNVYTSSANVEAAKEHLAAAMAAVGISDPSQISIKLKISEGSATNTLIVENCQDQWQRTLGINVEIEYVTYKAMLADRRNGDFELVYAGWMPDYDDPYTYLSYFLSDSYENGGKFASAKYDELVRGGCATSDAQTRLAMYAEAETILLEEGGIVPLQIRQVPFAYDKNLKGLVRFYLGADIDYTYAYFVAE